MCKYWHLSFEGEKYFRMLTIYILKNATYYMLDVPCRMLDEL